jgi:hypothetical protein
MCDYCDKDKLNILIESEKINGNLIGWNKEMLATELLDLIDDNSVVLEIRNGQGYIRLGNRMDMQCIDHEEKIKINYCPICGRKLCL